MVIVFQNISSTVTILKLSNNMQFQTIPPIPFNIQILLLDHNTLISNIPILPSRIRDME